MEAADRTRELGARSPSSGPGDLAGQVALITGAGRGIGRAIAMALAGQGAHCAVVSRTRDEIEETGRLLRELSPDVEVMARKADVSDRPQVDALVDQVWASLGPITVLVNNAGIFETHEFLKVPYERWRALVERNLAAAFHCSQAVADRMARAERGGRIVNVSSVNGALGQAWSSAYNVAKGALDALTRTLAVELAPYGILVNAVAPGFVDTDMSRARGESDLETELFREFYVGQRRIPLARAGRPEEVAQVVYFLASPHNTYMTGQTIAVDGGLSITY